MMGRDLVPVGIFTRILGRNGTLLLKPDFRDADFLREAKHLFHPQFATEFHISRISRKRSGFHVDFREVRNRKHASFFLGESAALPRSEITGRSTDLLVGLPVTDKAGQSKGTVVSVSPTPVHPVLTIESPDGRVFSVPLQEAFVIERQHSLVLTEEAMDAD